MICFGKSETGPVRSNNEDYCAYEQIGDYMCMVIADGLGGEACGEVASRTAADTLLDELRVMLSADDSKETIGKVICNAFNSANRKVLLDSLKDSSMRGMCTTLSAAIVKGRELVIGHIGDTRVYLCHGSNIIKLTQDHNEAAELIEKGLITEDEARSHGSRNRLVKVVGENQYLNPDIYSYNIIYGDLIILCSDGLYSFVGTGDIAAAVKNKSSLEAICDKLIALAIRNKSNDNMTILIGNTSLR
ncbi:MAG: protein phosphatase 2C domain-containing protein [Saccharofermentans sp.]|jgi:protein phosphatase|nr:protein phosphatase 2C domain-containing protein [Mageeibacillus sp.]MCI1263373.1 protein phosphatase 2C domain-containing protein [Saccharofermentans sp.]MCI1275915.1 protein phosphatase 2C domain-containing protein [Saccharofermentans sp.]MCI2043969.1 protein phosphatase 2C domain-containing protein [Mageeibacillus sp.]